MWKLILANWDVIRRTDRTSAAMAVFASVLIGLIGCELVFGAAALAPWGSLKQGDLRGSIEPRSVAAFLSW